MPAARRFPPPWTIDEHNDACFIVRDKTGRRWRTSVYAIGPPNQLKPSWGRQAILGGRACAPRHWRVIGGGDLGSFADYA